MTLLDRERLERRLDDGDMANWKTTRYRTFPETMTDESSPYPCYFAAEAQRGGYFRYLFANSPFDDDALAGLVDPPAGFLENYESFVEYPSIVMFFRPKPEDRSAEAYKREFWTVLRYLQRNDPAPWPSSVPTDPGHPEVAVLLRGRACLRRLPGAVLRAPDEPLHAPRSRDHVQPWGIFEGLTGLDDAGQTARTIILERLATYDDVEMHPGAGDFVDPRTREWKQYVLPETNEESVARCPLPERTDVDGHERTE